MNQEKGKKMSSSWRCLASVAVAAIGLYAAATAPIAEASPYIGINIQNVADYNGDLLFADAMKESRNWSTTNVDANGWPNQDASLYVWAGSSSDMSGTYALSFNGQATITAGGTITNQSYNSGTNTTTATLTMTNTDNNMSFTNTKKTSASGTNTGISNIKLMRPIAPGSGTSYSTATTFTTQIKNLIAKFGAIRFMDYLSTNGNQQINWSDRLNANYYSFNQSKTGYGWEGVGGAWEYAVQLANETNKDMWINIPEAATDAYVTNVANLILYGSDGNNPYTSVQGSPVFAPLNAGLKVYVEFSNEVWNTGGAFTQSGMNHTQAVNEVNAGGSPLNFDGDTNDWDWAWRRTAKRGKEISDLFRNVFGSGAMITRVRPVMESQLGYGDGPLLQALHLLEDYYNNPAKVGTPHPPSYYFYGGGGSAYYNPDNSSDTLTLSNIWTSQSFDVTQWAPTLQSDINYILPTIGKRTAYEGGPSLDNLGHSEAIKAQAWSDANMTTCVTNHQINWNQNAGDLLMYFDSVGDYQWAFTHDINTLSTAKLTGINNINGSTTATSTWGTAIPATITASTFSEPPGWVMGGFSPNSMNAANNWNWFNYNVKVATAGSFNIAVSAGSTNANGRLDVYVDGALAGTITIPNTGSTSVYANSATISTPSLSVGTHGLQLKAKADAYNVQSIIITNGSGGPPPAPTGLTATAGNAQVALTWNASGGATSYNVKRSTVSGSGYAQVANVATTSYTNTGLTNGTTYYFVVTALNALGESANSAQASATPQPGPPPVPTGLAATPGNAQVALSWNASAGATAYDVKRSTVSGSGYVTVSSPTVTNYTNTGLTNGTTYYFVVDAKNAGGTSANSSQVSATPSAGTSGLISINCGGPAVSPFVADIDFSGGTAATNWTGAIDTSGLTGPAPQAVYQSERYGAMTYTIGGLTNGTNYKVRLHMCENYFTASGLRTFNVSINGISELSSFDIYATAGAVHKGVIREFTVAANGSGQEVIAFTNVVNNALINGVEVVALTAPPAPTGLTATAGNAQVALTWNASSGATSYNVKRSTVSGSGYITVSSPTTTSYTNTGLTNGTTYYFVVTAVNAAGESGNSNQASATPTGSTGTQFATEPFAEATGALNGANGGTGWAAGWVEQSGSTTVPGYNVSSTGLTYTGLTTTGNKGVGGLAFETSGRCLNVTSGGPFGTAGYLNGGLIGATGKTIWFSALIRKDAATEQVNSLALHAGGIAWYANPALVSVGYFGAPSDNGGNRYWTLEIGGTVYRTTVPITVGTTSLLVMSITFGATNTVNLYVNPTSLGGNPPAATISGTNTTSLAFQSLAWYAGDAAGQSSLDEIKFGDSYAAVTR